ncbi:asparaginase [Candidatus Berkelbacteria bacterium]|nr:asparaginase [Candidatus Berkelbacteria bacterium]
MISKLLVIGTGGSFDGEVGDEDEIVPTAESALPEYFRRRVKLPYPVEVRVPCIKFSKDVTTEDMQKVVDLTVQTDASHILVSCGTGAMEAMAKFIAEGLGWPDRSDKTVTVMGSRKPLVGVTPSDGPLQLGIALGELNHLERGTYTIYDGVVSSY